MLRQRYLQVVLMVLVLFILASCSGSTANQAGQPAVTANSEATAPLPVMDTPTIAASPVGTEPAAADNSTTTASGSAQVVPEAGSTASPDISTATAVLPETGATLSAPTPQSCQPTQPDMLGPFYVPGAPERSQVGQGYVLTGVVRSAVGCAPIPGAQVELWMAGPNGEYSNAYRATIIVGQDGVYRFESHAPPPYSGRPPHIHLRVTAEGYAELVTQHYPSTGQTQSGDGVAFDLVLLPK